MAMLGKTLRLFLVDGTPEGILIAEIINWTGQVARLPRAMLGEFLARKESNRTGVYLLIGDDDEVPGRLRVYVGESDNLGNRLRQHINSTEKAFWDYACVITSKDQNLTKAHGLFLESKIIERALSADRVTLENSQTNTYENIPESDISDMTYFFEQVSVLLPALGVEMFSPSILDQQEHVWSPKRVPIYEPNTPSNSQRRSPDASLEPITGSSKIQVMLRDQKFGIVARGLESNGQILVLNGSQARGENESETNIYRQLRNRLIKEGKLNPSADPRVLNFSGMLIDGGMTIFVDAPSLSRRAIAEPVLRPSMRLDFRVADNDSKIPAT
jgi:hypothetical protein